MAFPCLDDFNGSQCLCVNLINSLDWHKRLRGLLPPNLTIHHHPCTSLPQPNKMWSLFSYPNRSWCLMLLSFCLCWSLCRNVILLFLFCINPSYTSKLGLSISSENLSHYFSFIQMTFLCLHSFSRVYHCTFHTTFNHWLISLCHPTSTLASLRRVPDLIYLCISIIY